MCYFMNCIFDDKYCCNKGKQSQKVKLFAGKAKQPFQWRIRRRVRQEHVVLACPVVKKVYRRNRNKQEKIGVPEMSESHIYLSAEEEDQGYKNGQ